MFEPLFLAEAILKLYKSHKIQDGGTNSEMVSSLLRLMTTSFHFIDLKQNICFDMLSS